jgi:hypothetical protein
MWGYIFGMVTILGAFIAILAFVNGRHTRKTITEVITREERLTREAIAEEGSRTREMIKATTEALGRLVVEVSKK